MESNYDAGSDPVQESFGQKTAALTDVSQDSHWRNAGHLADSPRTYTFGELSAFLEVNESTLRKRWWEKLETAYQHCPEALRVAVRTTKAGSPVLEFTEFGLQVLQEFKAANDQGCGDRYLQAVALQYPALLKPEALAPEPTPIAAVTVETGNHQMVLATPHLPQTYSLEGLRADTAIQFEDPLALAAQFLKAADLVTSAMQEDLQQREAKLNQTRQAKDAIAKKATELHLEQRLYQERAHYIDSTQTRETASLRETLSTLQALGKPTTATTPPAGD